MALLRERRENAESDLVEKTKMEPLKKLVIHFDRFSAEELKQCRELIGEVVDWDSLWEVEI